jgi:hypothetical protein
MATESDKPKDDLSPEKLGIERETRIVQSVEIMPRYGMKRTRAKLSKITLAKVNLREE